PGCTVNQGACGDGNIDYIAGEECDDGNMGNNDYCSFPDCETIGSCGDGIIQVNEACDNATFGDGTGAYCINDCQTIISGICGDGIYKPEAGEECDLGEGNFVDYAVDMESSCKSDCKIGRYCGDGILDGWQNPSAWNISAGVSWDEIEEALKFVSVLKPRLNKVIPIDTSKRYYLEYDVMVKNTFENKGLYAGTISYNSDMTQLPTHPGGYSYDYFGDLNAKFEEGVWYHRKNNLINGNPRTGESSNTSIWDAWHTGTAFAQVQFIFNYNNTSTQETYIKNLRFYTVEDGLVEFDDGELCDNGLSNLPNGTIVSSYMTECSDTCKWINYCGDGKVDGTGGDGYTDGPEVCDDGEYNGVAGFCNRDCSGYETQPVEINWTLATDSAGFGYRFHHASAVYNNKIWVLAGKDGYEGGGTDIIDDVNNSSDGTTWSLAAGTPAFGRMHSPASVVFNSKIWIVGGFSSGGTNLDNVYSSSDGITWSLATSTPGWAGRYDHGAVIFNNKIWVAGGSDWHSAGTIGFSDVWSSSDGISWTKVKDSAPWGTRGSHILQVYDNKMWLIGGIIFNDYAGTSKNDVWYSTDGVNWTEATSNSGITAGGGYSSVVFDNKMWVIGTNKAWYSTDGINWTSATMNNAFPTRKHHTSVVFNNKIWVIGGDGSSTNPRSDVWYGEIAE
ncbi:MAG TPA: hypothetical protein PLD55_15065, partial [bacterium]|nr:hypothetical protein [bacterium]